MKIKSASIFSETLLYSVVLIVTSEIKREELSHTGLQVN